MKNIFTQNINTTFELLLVIKSICKTIGLDSIVQAKNYRSTMVNIHEIIPNKTTEENADVTISAACNLEDGGTLRNSKGIFDNNVKFLLLKSY